MGAAEGAGHGNGGVHVAQWFVGRRGRAVAVVMLGLAASSALLPPVTQALISAVGWREAYLALGVLLMPATVLIARNRPEEVGLHPDGRVGPGRVQGPATMVTISALAPLPLAAFRQLSGDYSLGLLIIAAIPIACAVIAYLFDPERARRDAETI